MHLYYINGNFIVVENYALISILFTNKHIIIKHIRIIHISLHNLIAFFQNKIFIKIREICLN